MFKCNSSTFNQNKSIGSFNGDFWILSSRSREPASTHAKEMFSIPLYKHMLTKQRKTALGPSSQRPSQADQNPIHRSTVRARPPPWPIISTSKRGYPTGAAECQSVGVRVIGDGVGGVGMMSVPTPTRGSRSTRRSHHRSQPRSGQAITRAPSVTEADVSCLPLPAVKEGIHLGIACRR